MAQPAEPENVALLIGLLSVFDGAFDQAERRLEQLYGALELRGGPFEFDFTDYYERETGSPIKRRFLLMHELISPGALADIKLATNAIEREIAESGDYPVARPVNIDPGYLAESKLVLASAKDYSHRIYLRDGIYAEVTLMYRDGAFHPLPWTYPDFQSEGYMRFLIDARAALRRLRKSGAG